MVELDDDEDDAPIIEGKPVLMVGLGGERRPVDDDDAETWVWILLLLVVVVVGVGVLCFRNTHTVRSSPDILPVNKD